MKQKLILVLISIVLVQSISFGQNKPGTSNVLMTLYADNGIDEITVTDNIDVILIQGTEDDLSVKGIENTFDLIDLKIQGQTLIISPKKQMISEKRVAVFITVSELRRLNLLGDSFATSRGKLTTRNLLVTISDQAKIQLGSKGRIMVDTPDNYQVLREKQCVSAFAINKS